MPRASGRAGSRGHVAALVTAALATMAAADAATDRGAPPDLAALVSALDAYLVAYETAVSALVADEHLTQRVEAANHQVVGYRVLDSEVAFLRLPGNREWLAHRRVARVDGAAVANGEPRSLTALLGGSGDAQRMAASVVEESARHNLGLPRSINVPTLPFELAHPRRRDRYRVRSGGADSIGGQPLTVIELVERGRGGIVHFGPRAFFHSTVRLWMRGSDGAVFRAAVHLRPPERTAFDRGDPEVRVEFTWHDGLRMHVPAALDEIFLADGALGRGHAEYANYRRFAVTARVLPGG